MKRLLTITLGLGFLAMLLLEGWSAERAKRRAAEKRAAVRS